MPAGWLSGFPLSSDPWSSAGISCTGNWVPGPSKGGQVPHWQPTAGMNKRGGMQKGKARKHSQSKMGEVQNNMSITFTPMSWPYEDRNKTALLGLEILFHFSLWAQPVCLKSTALLFVVCVVLSTAEMNCFLNVFKYIQTSYNGGTWLTEPYNNDFPPVTFITITESWYFTAEPVFTILLSQAELTHACSLAERNKTNCFRLLCKIKAASVKILGHDQLRYWLILTPAELNGALGKSLDLPLVNRSMCAWPWS